MSTIPKHHLDKIKDVAMCDYEDDQVNAFKDGAQYGYQLATDGREELEEVKQLYKMLHEQYNRKEIDNGNLFTLAEIRRKEIDKLILELGTLQSQCTEKDSDNTNLRATVANLHDQLSEKDKECEGFDKRVDKIVREYNSIIEELKAEKERLSGLLVSLSNGEAMNVVRESEGVYSVIFKTKDPT